MKLKDAVASTRVYWPGTDVVPADHGVIVPYSTYMGGVSTTFLDEDSGRYSVWVKWDSDGEIQHIGLDEVEVIRDAPARAEPELTVEKCIMFLLENGYTVSKSGI